MNREQAIEIILQHGEGPPEGSAEHRELMAFLETSPECRQIYERQRELWSVLDSWEPAEPSSSFDGRLLARIQAEEVQQSWLRRLLGVIRPSFAVGLAVLTLAAGVVLQQRPEPARSAQWTGGESAAVEQIDRMLDDIEMLAEFDVLPLAEPGKGES